MLVSFPVSLPISWQVPDGLVIAGYCAVLGLLHLLLAATVIQLLRRHRAQLILVAVAAYAWTLGMWSDAAAGVAPVRSALGGAATFLAIGFGVQLVFVGLTLVVVAAAWRRLHAARTAIQPAGSQLAGVHSIDPPPASLPPPAPLVDAEAWLR